LAYLTFSVAKYVFSGKGNEVSLIWYRGFALKNRTYMVSIALLVFSLYLHGKMPVLGFCSLLILLIIIFFYI